MKQEDAEGKRNRARKIAFLAFECPGGAVLKIATASRAGSVWDQGGA